MAKRCPTCNRSSDEIAFVGEFCRSCASKRFSEKIPAEVEIERCRVCGGIRTKEGIREESKLSLNSAIGQRLTKFKVKVIQYNQGKALLDVVGDVPGGSVSTEKEVEIRYKKMTCETCYKKIGGYYEATVQLRGEPERVSRFAERISRYVENHNGFIAKVENVEGGLDIYISNKSLASGFISEKGLKATLSSTLSGLNNSGKKVYKNTYAIRV